MEVGLTEIESDYDCMTGTCRERAFECFTGLLWLMAQKISHTLPLSIFLPVKDISLVGYIQLVGSLVFVFCAHNNPTRHESTDIDEFS